MALSVTLHFVIKGLCPIEIFLKHFSRISLNTMTLQVDSPTVYTSQGVPISVTGIAQVFYTALIGE